MSYLIIKLSFSFDALRFNSIQLEIITFKLVIVRIVKLCIPAVATVSFRQVPY